MDGDNMDDMNYSSDVEYETESQNKKGGFKITRGMAILGVAFLLVLIMDLVHFHIQQLM